MIPTCRRRPTSSCSTGAPRTAAQETYEPGWFPILVSVGNGCCSVMRGSTFWAGSCTSARESSTDPISGKTTKMATLRFPRFHQWEAVTELTAAVTPKVSGGGT